MASIKSKYKKRFIFITINSLLVLVLFLAFQKLYFLPTGDADVFFYGPVLKNKVFKAQSDISVDDYLFIDTQHDNMLIEIANEGHVSNMPAVDRFKLIEFFKRVKAANTHKYIVCDIFFDYESEFDEELGSLLQSIDRLIIPRKVNLDETVEAYRNLNSGLVSNNTINGVFYKYTLFDRTALVKSLPLKLYEDIHQTELKPYTLFNSLDGHLIFNDFVPELRFRDYTVLRENRTKVEDPISKSEATNFKFSSSLLGNTLKPPINLFSNSIKDRILVIGNFKTDRKGTLYGNTPGSFVLMNTYLGIVKGENRIGFLLVLSLILIFALFSYFVIMPKDKIKKVLLRIPVIGSGLLGLGYVVFISFFGILLYFIFGNNLNLAYIGVVFYLQNLVFTRINFFKKIKNLINN